MQNYVFLKTKGTNCTFKIALAKHPPAQSISTISKVSWIPYYKHPTLPNFAAAGRHWGPNCKLLCLVLFPVSEIPSVWSRSTKLFAAFVFLSTSGKWRIRCLLQERLFKQTFPITFNSANTHHQNHVFYTERTIAKANIWKQTIL